MPEFNLSSLVDSQLAAQPFPHFPLTNILTGGLDKLLFDWFEQTDAWGLTETSFYKQYEFSFLDTDVPVQLSLLTSENTIAKIIAESQKAFGVSQLKLVGITAHKLVDGHKIGVHNDFIDGDETHRLLIQINENWQPENGGFLMLFNSKDPNDLASIIQPINNTGIAFEISPKSYHAVSTIHNFHRYTLVYTFSNN